MEKSFFICIFANKKIKMCNIIYTKEQEDIFKFVQTGVLNVLVEAVAGAGKTTTLIECVKRIIDYYGPDKQILLLAHNKSTKETLETKIKEKLHIEDLKNTKINVYTIHGLAWRLFGEHFDDRPVINENKYQDYISKNIDTIGSDAYKLLNGNNKVIYRSNLNLLISMARHYLKSGEREIKKLAKKLEIHLIADECHVVSNILKWGRENLKELDYQDLLYLPSVLGYFTRVFLADFILLDEAQDASIAQQDIISRCMRRNTRLIAFGDTDQLINSWCGSDIEAIEKILTNSDEKFNRPAKQFPLTTNYRCGKKIIEYAKRFSDKTNTPNEIKPRPEAQDGIVRFEMHLTDIKSGDMVLCRNTAPLMELYRRMVADGQKVFFRGEELGKNLLDSVNEVLGESMGEIIFNLKRKTIAYWDFFTKETGLDPKETMLMPVVVSNYDVIKTLEELPENIKNRNDLKSFVEDIFKDEGREGIQLSTIHRAKGLEADNVFIICPSLLPSRLARTEAEIAEEKRLQYVMCTRPKESLNFVTEKDISPNNAYSENNSFYEELMNIKNEIQTWEK